MPPRRPAVPAANAADPAMHESIAALWPIYFPTSEFLPDDMRLPIVAALAHYFVTPAGLRQLDVDAIFATGSLQLDFDTTMRSIPVADFASVLRDEPATVLACLSCAAHQAALAQRGAGQRQHRQQQQQPHSHDSFHVNTAVIPNGCVTVRLLRYAPLTALKHLKANSVDKYVAFRGNVVRVSPIRPLVTSMSFQCTRCGARHHRTFTESVFSPPTQCRGTCRNYTFTPDRSTAATIDWQTLKLQEIVSSSEADQGRIPRTVECELTRDLVDMCIPGDVVSLSGIVKARKSATRGRTNCLFILYLDVNSVDVSMQEDGQTGKLDILQFRDKDYQAIIEIAKTPDLFPFLVLSLCPAIYGNESVKAALLLVLMGGAQSTSSDKDNDDAADGDAPMSVRHDPHMLIVGDPGLGKSQLLRATAKVAPRGVYVCGNTTTSTGLTVTMVKDASAGGYALEAGALVLADQGVCCIDEFDKMPSEHNALLEAMEQQSIHIAKAGVVCSLAARTSVVAAANPVGGHYNRGKTVAENLRIATPLLSRFDIVFILLDAPDEARDQLLTEHVIGLHSGLSSSSSSSSVRGTPRGSPAMLSPFRSPQLHQHAHTSFQDRQRRIASSQVNAPLGGGHGGARRRTLAERLRQSSIEHSSVGFEALPAWLLRKYIAYAKRYVHPRLTRGAKSVLQDFYLTLRRDHQSVDGTPITTRQLESMVRLAQARAKVELREVVTADDALDVVDIMKESLYDVFADDDGFVDFRRAGGQSKAAQTTAFMRALHRKSKQRGSNVFTVADMQAVATHIGLQVPHFQGFLDTLNQQNYILQRGSNKYAVQSIDL